MSGIETPHETAAQPPTPWAATASSPDFTELRRRLRGFVLPTTALFLLWYALYVLLATYAPALLAHRIGGNITVGLAIGVAQILSTFVVTAIYLRYARRRLDPLAERVRALVGEHANGAGMDRDGTEGAPGSAARQVLPS